MGLNYSVNGSKTWEATAYPQIVAAGARVTLEALGPNSALLVSGAMGSFGNIKAYSPLMLTETGGRTWTAVTMPKLPAQAPGWGPHLVVMPNGALLYVDQGPWLLLRPGTSSWCRVLTPPSAPPELGPVPVFAVQGTNLWWLATGGPERMMATGGPERMSTTSVRWQ